MIKKSKKYISLIFNEYNHFKTDLIGGILLVYIIWFPILSIIWYFFWIIWMVILITSLSFWSVYFFSIFIDFWKPNWWTTKLKISDLINIFAISFVSLWFVWFWAYKFASSQFDIYFYLWLAAGIAIPSSLYIYEIITKWWNIVNYIDISILVKYDAYYPVMIDNLEFISSKNKKKIVFKHLNWIFDTSKKYMEYDKFENFNLKNKYFLETKQIPENGNNSLHDYEIHESTDSFNLNYYSFVEDKFYSDCFPLALNDLLEWEKSINGKRFIRDVTLRIFPWWNMILLNHENRLISNFTKIETLKINAKNKESYIDDYIKKIDFNWTKKELLSELKSKEIKKRTDSMIKEMKFYNRILEIENKEKIVNITDGIYNEFRYKTWTRSRWPLPYTINFKKISAFYTIYLNKVEIADQISEIELKKDDVVNLSINKNILKIKVNKTEIYNWEIEIYKDN